ncbi:translation initiation factor eIF-2B subunit beta [Tanacetum coccineum]
MRYHCYIVICNALNAKEQVGLMSAFEICGQYHDGSWLSHQQMSLLQHQRENVNFLNQEISKHTLSKEFIARGLQTIVFTNSDVFAMISRVNMAHVVMANGGVIAPFGLNIVALAAQRHVSFVVLAGIHKKNKINAPKYSAMMAPIIVISERRLASTSQKPDTPHEMWFHNEYMGQIKAAISQSSISLGEVAPQQLLKFRVIFSF